MRAQFTVYQIILTESEAKLLNEKGWEAFPKARARALTMLGAAKFKPEFSLYYQPAWELEARHLEEVFDTLNLYQNQATRLHAKAHGMSVGDLVEDLDGNRWFCDAYGFQQIAGMKEADKRGAA